VLARIAGSFADAGINITSLAVGEMEDESASRMTIVVRCARTLLAEAVKHLRKLPDVLDVEDLDRREFIERELMLVRVRAEGEDIARIMQLVEIFRAAVAGLGKGSLTIEISGPESKVDALLNLLRPFGILELARTGRVAIEHVEHGDVG
jgi:acetolactate synthase-1/3 small subunit